MKIKGLSLIAITCLGLFFWINFIDFKFPECSVGSGKKIESLIENLSLSYIGGFIFYYLNIYLVEQSERKLITPFIHKQAYFIVQHNISIIKALKNDKKLADTYFPNDDEFYHLLGSTFPLDKHPFYLGSTWSEVLNLVRNRTKERIDKLFLSGKYMDEELRSILLSLLDSGFYEDSEFVELQYEDNLSLVNCHFSMPAYFKGIKRLKEYHDRNPYHPYRID